MAALLVTVEDRLGPLLPNFHMKTLLLSAMLIVMALVVLPVLADDDGVEQLEKQKRDNLIDARTIIECLANTPTNIYIATYPDICFPQPDNEVEDLILEVPLRKKLNSVLGCAKVKYCKNCECCPGHSLTIIH